ncbi:hypocretin neuropeptide precursor isoform X2 [Pelodiscus sinensis]|uniref:hypocretin neuropeptide precursor isoform X2 n=1 Tax=Pelodiscus sinensis TaxID=13735 RepID=UPI0003C4449B|nr:orexin isoform X2 [Pelodiscus sinensis]|eukprot:XP_006113180.1 orexin isoform X2 [Pelodiscus sinensis]
MAAPNAKIHKASCLLLLALLCSLAAAGQSMPVCCRQKTCPCRVYDVLHGLGNHAAGILTLGKRRSSSQAFQSQLYRLLHGSGNHAAGILTMGKREDLAPEQPASACRDASPYPTGLLPLAPCAANTDPASTRECLAPLDQGQSGVAAKSFS